MKSALPLATLLFPGLILPTTVQATPHHPAPTPKTGLTLKTTDLPALEKTKTLNRDFKSNKGSTYRLLKIDTRPGWEGDWQEARFTLIIAPRKAARRGLKASEFSFTCFAKVGSVGGGSIGQTNALGQYEIVIHSPDLPDEIESLELQIRETNTIPPKKKTQALIKSKP